MLTEASQFHLIDVGWISLSDPFWLLKNGGGTKARPKPFVSGVAVAIQVGCGLKCGNVGRVTKCSVDAKINVDGI